MARKPSPKGPPAPRRRRRAAASRAAAPRRAPMYRMPAQQHVPLKSLIPRRGAITGRGEYTVKGNSLMPDLPLIYNKKSLEGAMIVRHTEYIGDVQASTLFDNQYQIALNPALASSFPWLSQIASSFTQYQWLGLVFSLKSTSGNYSSANQALGQVAVATDYNVLGPAFTDLRQVLIQTFSTVTVPTQSAIHPIECAPNQTSVPLLYTRTGPVPAGADARLYDLGLTQICVQDSPNPGTNIMQLWCDYECAMYKPQIIPVGEGAANKAAHWSLANTVSLTAEGGDWPIGDNYVDLSTGGAAEVFNNTTGPVLLNRDGLVFGASDVGTWLVNLSVEAPSSVGSTFSVAGMSGWYIPSGANWTTEAVYFNGDRATTRLVGVSEGAQICPADFAGCFVLTVTGACVIPVKQLVSTSQAGPTTILGGDLVLTLLPAGFVVPT